MQVNTGHLVSAEFLERLTAEKRADYVEVPKGLDRAARRALKGRSETHISLTSGGKLSRFAAEKRKAKRAAQKKARKAGRK